MDKLHHIDTLRGIAILMVIFNHVCESIENLPPIISELGYFGKYGVQLFFVMSAYTLCLSMYNRKEKKSLLNYFIRRFFRIAPLYYIGIFIYFLAYWIDTTYNIQTYLPNENYSLKTVLTNLTFSHGLFSDTFNALVLGGWSIGTEMAFYLIFPLLFHFYSKIKKTYLYITIPFLLALIIAFFFRTLPHAFPPLSNHNFEFYYCSVLNQLPVFLIGISLFFYTNNQSINSNIIKYSLPIFSIFIGLMILSKHFNYINDITLYPFLVALSFIFLFFIAKNYSAINFKIIRKIGQLSYSIYILHFIFAWCLSSYLNIWLKVYINPTIILIVAFSSTVIFSFVFSLLTQYFIETRGIELGKKLILKLNK